MKLIIIAAHDNNLLIGKDGGLPWHVPEDMEHFKRTTRGKTVLMGRGVFDEIGRKPLPNRRNVIISTQDWSPNECYQSVEEALENLKNEDEVFVIGGGVIYQRLINECDYMYITHIHGEYQGDVYFPEYRHQVGTVWKEVLRKESARCTFLEYSRT